MAKQGAEGQPATVSGILALTTSESKRLIGKGVAALPEVQRAMRKGRIIIANGTTNAYVAEELLGIPVHKSWYCRGYIVDGAFAHMTRTDLQLRAYALVDGKPVETMPNEVLAEFESNDVFIKGGNALDLDGNVGILLGGYTGGTIGEALAIVTTRGCHYIAPVGLEKLVPSVPEAAKKCGLWRLKYPQGTTLGMMPVSNAKVISEIEALQLLGGVKATHVASGGIAGSEGAVVLVVEGEEEPVLKAFELVNSIKGEPPVPHPGEVAAKYGPDHPTGRPPSRTARP